MEIPNFKGYHIDTYGNITSYKRFKDGRPISPYTDKDGYRCASLRTNGKSKAMKVHRLVAIVYIPNPKNYPQVNHINGIKTDNKVENLEWVDNITNQRHAWNNDFKTIKLTNKNIETIKQLLKEGNSNTKIARIFNVDQSTISNIKTGKIWNRK